MPKLNFKKPTSLGKPNSNQQPEIKFTDPVEAIRQKYDSLLGVIIAVLFIGFVTLLITVSGFAVDAWNSKTIIYHEYMKQDSKIDQEKLTQEQVRILSQKIEQLRLEINSSTTSIGR